MPTSSRGSTENLDPAPLRVTFVGQQPQRFERIRHVGPVDSHGVARLLREHDAYLAASRDDPCSNALLEALACGLPAVYLDERGASRARRRRGRAVRDAARSCRTRSRGSRAISTGTASRSASRRSPRWPTRTFDVLGDRRDLALESLPVQNYARRAVTSARFRLDRRLDRAAVARAHDVLYESDAWTQASWLGAQALKNPLDLWVYQEIMVETRPELVVETGTYRGGSALYLASLCDLLNRGEVVSIDIEPMREDYPEHPRITYLAGRSSTDPGVIEEVRERGRRASRYSSSSTPTTRRATSRRSSRPTRHSFPSAAT